MRLEIKRDDFARVLATAVKVVESRNTIPVLGTVRLVASAGVLTATATDLDIEVSAEVPASGDAAYCVSATLLEAAVRKLPAGDVVIEGDDREIVIKAGRARFKFRTLPIDDFPAFADVGDHAIEFEADLAALAAPVKFAMSTETARYYLNGIYLHPVDGKLCAVATDGHRMSRHIGSDVPDFSGVILGRKMVDLIPAGTITIGVTDTKIRLAKDGLVFLSKLVDGTYPDYQRVIPTRNEKRVSVDRKVFASAVDRVAVVSGSTTRAAKISVLPGAIELSLRGDGEGDDSVPAEYSGEPIDIGFNSKYLADALAVFADGDVTIASADGGSPALLSGKAEGLVSVLMPMRV